MEDVIRLDNPKLIFVVFTVAVLVAGSVIVYSIYKARPIMVPLTYKMPVIAANALPQGLDSVSVVMIPAEELTLEINKLPAVTAQTTPEAIRDSLVLFYRVLAEGIGNQSVRRVIVYIIEYPWGASVLLVVRALRYVPFGLEINLNIH